MKTKKELLDFYGVKDGKEYVVTDSTLATVDVGAKMRISVIGNVIKVFFPNDGYADISILKYLSYKEVKQPIPILNKEEKQYVLKIIEKKFFKRHD